MNLHEGTMKKLFEEAHVCVKPLTYGRNKQPLFVAPCEYGWLNGTLIIGSLMKPLWLVKPLAMMMCRSTPIRFKFKLNIKNIK